MTAIMAKSDAKAAKKAEPAPAAAPAPAAPEAPVEAEDEDDGEDEDEIVAVIAAAVACMAASEGTRLKVKSFRRVGSNAPAWNKAGRADALQNRF